MSIKPTTFSKKIGFTIIEIIMVIVIIGLILGMTIHFGSDNIFKLKNKTSKEEFITNFNLFYTQAIESNYIDQQRFDILELKLSSGENYIYYKYSGDSINKEGIKTTNIKISNLKIDNGSITKESTIQIKPYQIGCSIKDGNNQWGSRLDFEIIANNTKRYCIYLLSTNCKITEQEC